MMTVIYPEQMSEQQRRDWQMKIARLEQAPDEGRLTIEADADHQLAALDLDHWLERAVKRRSSFMVRYRRELDDYQAVGVSYTRGEETDSRVPLPVIEVGTKPCLFLDRDGVINADDQYIYRQQDVRWMPGIVEGLKEVAAHGIELVVLTNQSGVGRGYYREEDVLNLHQWMRDELSEKGVELKHWYYCPYHPQAKEERYRKQSPLRKPGSAMAEMAFADLDLDPRRSVMVGDKTSDQLDHLDMKTYFIKGLYELPAQASLIEQVGLHLFD